jgi:hypothetical protein
VRTIILITVREFNKQTRRYETVVSHGIDEFTNRNIVLSNDLIEYYVRNCGAVYDDLLGHYVMLVKPDNDA